MATFVSPRRQGRPKVSLMMTAMRLRVRIAERDSEIFRGPVGISGKQCHGIVARNIRMIHARIGADVAVECFGNEHGIAADEAPRFFQDHFHEPGIFLLPLRDGPCLRRRRDGCQTPLASFGFRNNLLRHDKDIAVFEMQARFARGICYLSG